MRIEGWESRLALLCEAEAARPFVRGVHDCCTFARAAEIALTGETLFGDSGGWRTAAGARRALRRMGFASIRDMLDARLPPCPPAMARRGDLIMTDAPGADDMGAIAVVTGTHAVLPGPDGLLRVPVLSATHAWRVG